MTAILIVTIPMLIIVGSFMWLKPSARDQYLAKLRRNGLGSGFRLGSLRVPDLTEFGRVNEKYEIITLYQKSLVVVKDDRPTLTVLRTTGQSGAFLPDGWQWQNRVGLNDLNYQSLYDVLVTLPVSITAIELSRDLIGLSWDEKDPAITFLRISDVLQSVADIFKITLV